MRALLSLSLLPLITCALPVVGQTRMLDDFARIDRWTALPSDGVTLTLSQDSGHAPGSTSLRLDYDFHGGGGYAIARRDIPVALPEDYEFAFWIRGDAQPQNLEFKLVDASGDNVWWYNRRDFRFPRQWARLTTRKRHIEFAWGPVRDDALRRVSAIEFAITAGSGGKGTVWIADITLTQRGPAAQPDGPPQAAASSSSRDGRPALAFDGDTATAWRSGAAGEQSLDVDLRAPREFGAIVLRWAPGEHAMAYDVLTSTNGREWATQRRVTSGGGGTDFLYLPEREARFIRLLLHSAAGSRGYTLRELEIKPVDWAPTPNAFFERIAAESPRGRFPKYFLGTQSYWTVAGVNGDDAEALMNEEGMVEVQAGAFSIEPFIQHDNRLFTWNEASLSQRLESGYLPIPSVRWSGLPLELEVTALASGPADSSTLWIRYRVVNSGAEPRTATLYLALRPFQVNPSPQFLNSPGGVGRIESIEHDGNLVRVNSDRSVVPVTAPSRFGAASFAQGDITDFLARGTIPPATTVRDESGWAAAVLGYPVDLAPHDSADVWVAIPLHPGSPPPPVNLPVAHASSAGTIALATEAARWRSELGRVGITLPPSAARIERSLRSNLAYILINRDGPAIQPGSRSYARSWIRDGSLTSEALLRLGHEREVREFIEWFAPFQFASGKVPCCVDRRGGDPVPENDSHGQLVYAIAEYWRFTRDTAFVQRMWPHVTRAITYMDSLRHSRMTDVYRRDSVAYFGLLPESISHEGYSAKPMHSYWDNFFALKGFKDAADLARVVGDTARAATYASLAVEFRRDLLASFERAMIAHAIDYLPGSVELGDFDATSITVGISPGGELAQLPRVAVNRTFERYWENFLERRDSDTTWDAYTPYEHRVTGTFVRLGQPDRAHALLEFFFSDQRPEGWNHWAEVVFRDSRRPGFIGDMPHTWVGSDFIRSVLDMFAYEREEDSTLVLAAGIPAEWIGDRPGVSVDRLRTHYGRLSYAMRREDNVVHLNLAAGSRVPPGGIVINPGGRGTPRFATVNGRPAMISPAGEIVVRQLPAEIRIGY